MEELKTPVESLFVKGFLSFNSYRRWEHLREGVCLTKQGIAGVFCGHTQGRGAHPLHFRPIEPANFVRVCPVHGRTFPGCPGLCPLGAGSIAPSPSYTFNNTPSSPSWELLLYSHIKQKDQ